MFGHLAAITTLALLVVVEAQQAGTVQAEVHPALPIQKCTGSGSSATCTTINTKIVLDANWRWLHSTTGTTNCYTGNSWNTMLCPDGKTCAANCALEGVNYADTYGITISGNALNLKLLTGTNVGSRVYLLADDSKYYMFKLKNQEFTFDVDLSTLGCGLNSALYLTAMDEDGGVARSPGNTAGAKYGTGYCDAQCPANKFVNGEAILGSSTGIGSCCTEVDILEANSQATSYTLHPCSVTGQYRCSGTDCGQGSDRFSSVCDMDGCGYNAWQMGNQTFYGTGKTIDTRKKFTVITQFITSDNTANGDLTEVRRLWVQDGVVYQNSNTKLNALTGSSLSDGFCSAQKSTLGDNNAFKSRGGMAAIGDAIASGMVLTFSLWTDSAAHMLWLDSNYPTGADPSKPGVSRGPCPTDSGNPADVLREQPDATVSFSNVKIGDIGSTYSGSSRSGDGGSGITILQNSSGPTTMSNDTTAHTTATSSDPPHSTPSGRRCSAHSH